MSSSSSSEPPLTSEPEAARDLALLMGSEGELALELPPLRSMDATLGGRAERGVSVRFLPVTLDVMLGDLLPVLVLTAGVICTGNKGVSSLFSNSPAVCLIDPRGFGKFLPFVILGDLLELRPLDFGLTPGVVVRAGNKGVT